jgi:predicted site-specific integrase-resolvase
MIKGYARVSTDGQTLEAQQQALQEAGATRVFAEKQSGIKTDRAALARCLASLEPGDTLLVTKLDRLARSTRDLLKRGCEGWGDIPVTRRLLGRHHHAAWPLDGDGAGWIG